MEFFTERPALADLKGREYSPVPPPPEEWDIEPADLNRWLESGDDAA